MKSRKNQIMKNRNVRTTIVTETGRISRFGIDYDIFDLINKVKTTKTLGGTNGRKNTLI